VNERGARRRLFDAGSMRLLLQRSDTREPVIDAAAWRHGLRQSV
jgi:hypothetical protein